jgi:hypothetical protein
MILISGSEAFVQKTSLPESFKLISPPYEISWQVYQLEADTSYYQMYHLSG